MKEHKKNIRLRKKNIIIEERIILKKRIIVSLILVLFLTLTGCGNASDNDASGGDLPVTEDETEMGELVPSITILTSLPEENMVNYEMSKEVAAELQKLGVDITAQPTDFAVTIDTIYGEDSDYDAYTIGWSGRVERLDPDMFIHSINHSNNAEAGGNNTDKYRSAEFDVVADALLGNIHSLGRFGYAFFFRDRNKVIDPFVHKAAPPTNICEKFHKSTK